MLLSEKADHLKEVITDLGRVALAFSGGVDSSLLVKIALDTLGAGNVLILFGRSILLKSTELDAAQTWLKRHKFPQGVTLHVVDLQPLLWKEFFNNPEDRCYLCKLRIYKQFKEEMDSHQFSILADGTNIDDLKDRRPGLRAIRELGVKTPLVEAGFDKSDVRQLSRQLGLDTWQLPSASCLATRIPHGVKITEDRIRQIEFWENGLEKMGFKGCRVKLDRNRKGQVFIQVQAGDLETLHSLDIRVAMLRFFQNNGVKKIYLDLEGR